LWNTSVSTWSFVYEWIVFIRPLTTPMRSSSAFTSGARQLVVHEALEMTVSDALRSLWLTPMTTVRSTSFSPGAETMTFRAPACRCAPAFALLVKSPVHSSTTSTPRAFHGSLAGSRSATTWMLSSPTTMAFSFTCTDCRNGPCTVSYFRRWALVAASPRSLMATNCKSCFLLPASLISS
jgi:hypothetical protein